MLKVPGSMPRTMPAATSTNLAGNGDTRTLILEAALEAFSEKGFDGARARDIAAGAGVNHGLIRYYFGSKLQLWKAAVDRAFAELSDGLGALAGGAVSDREQAGLLIRQYVHFVGRNPEFVRLMHDEGKRRGPRMRWLVDRHVRPLYEAVSELLQHGRALRGLPGDIAPIHLHYILAGSVGLMFHQSEECKRLSGVDPSDESVIEEHARIVEYMLLGPP